MPTNFPNSIDSPTDPTAAQPMNAPSHSSQHANANDALVAIETAIGTTSAPKFATTTSPTFVGVPTAPNAAALTNTTQLANTAFVTGAVGTETTNRTNAVNLKANIAAPTFTGIPSAPTATVGTNTTQLATTAFVLANAPSGGSEFTGQFVYDIGNYGTIDPTGSVDSTAAILAAIAAAAANPQGGIVWLRAGIFKISSALVVNSPWISIIGAGNSATVLMPTSALNGEVCLTVQMNPFDTGTPASTGAWLSAGTFKDFSINGTNTTGAVGLQFGDIVGATVDLYIQKFHGTNAIGAHMVNQTGWTEECFIRLTVYDNLIGSLFEATGGGYNSFGYNDIDIFIGTNGTGQVGVQVSTSVIIYHSKFRMRGNVNVSGNIGLNIVYDGSHYGGLPEDHFDITFECSAGTIPIQSGGYVLFSGDGIVDTTGNVIVNSTTAWAGGYAFNGYWGVAGFTPGAGIFITSSNIPTVGGTLALLNGTNTAAGATATAPTFVSGTALKVNANTDSILYVEVTTAAALAIAIGPTSTPANTIVSSITAALGLLTIRVPATWYVKITGTIADLNINAVSC